MLNRLKLKQVRLNILFRYWQKLENKLNYKSKSKNNQDLKNFCKNLHEIRYDIKSYVLEKYLKRCMQKNQLAYF